MLLEKIQSDLKDALRDKDKVKVATLRLLLAEIHNQKIAKQEELAEEEVVGVIRKEAKKRKEAIEAYQHGKRDDLVKKERHELEILKKYLPQTMSPEELEKIVDQTIMEVGAKGKGDFGKVMGAVMGKVKGKAEGAEVARVVKKMID